MYRFSCKYLECLQLRSDIGSNVRQSSAAELPAGPCVVVVKLVNTSQPSKNCHWGLKSCSSSATSAEGCGEYMKWGNKIGMLLRPIALI